MKRRIGLLGGTFDPVHVGHLDLAAAAERFLQLTSIVMIPSHVPPHRPSPHASPFHRFAMVAMAVADRPAWTASDMELVEPDLSFTSATLDRLHRAGFDATELFFIIGVDAFREIASWKDYPAILDKAHFAVVTRPGYPLQELRALLPHLAPRMRTSNELSDNQTLIILIDAVTTDVSATTIRKRVSEGSSIEGLVPVAVAQHIARHGLYSHAAADRRSSALS